MMQTHAKTGLSYNPEYLDAEFLDMLAELPAEELLSDMPDTGGLMTATPTAPMAPLSAEDTTALMEQSWAELLASEEGAEIAALPAEEQSQMKANFMATPAMPEAELAALVLPKNEVSYTEEDGHFEIRQNDAVLMSGLLGKNNAKQEKLSAFLISAGVTLADVIGIVMAAVGVVQALNKRALANGAKSLASRFAKAITRYSKEFKIAQRLDKLAAMQRTLGIAKSCASFPKLAGIMLSNMSGLEKAAAVATAVAGLTLALASGGQSVWLSVLAMAAAVTVFAIDLKITVDKYNAWQRA